MFAEPGRALLRNVHDLRGLKNEVILRMQSHSLGLGTQAFGGANSLLQTTKKQVSLHFSYLYSSFLCPKQTSWLLNLLFLLDESEDQFV